MKFVHAFMITIQRQLCCYFVGGILIRSNSSGNKSFNFRSLFNFMLIPYIIKLLWNFKSLDINYHC